MGDSLDYRMFDADNHYYESKDAFTRHLDPAFRRRVAWMTTERGHSKLAFDGKIYEYVPNQIFDPVSVPGSLTDMYKNEKSREQLAQDALAGYKVVDRLEDHPEYQDKDKRVEFLEQQGVEGAVFFPTLSSGIEQACSHDPELTTAVLSAFNAWIAEDWPYGYRDRIFSMPQISLVDVDWAVAELDKALSQGARAVLLRAAPVPCADGHRSPGDSRFDPFWARLQEAGAAAVFHAGDAGYNEYAERWKAGSGSGIAGIEASAFEFVSQEGRAVSDLLAAIVIHGVFTRFPNLKAMSVENGSDWVGPLVERLQKNYMHYPTYFTADPVEQFRQNVWISPHWEEDIPALAAAHSVDRIVAGSDYPHPEGLANPVDYIEGLAKFTPDEQRKILRDNVRQVLSLGT